MTRAYVYHDSFISVTCLIHMLHWWCLRDAYAKHDSLYLIHDMTHSHARHTPFVYRDHDSITHRDTLWLIHTRDTRHNSSYTYTTWLIRIYTGHDSIIHRDTTWLIHTPHGSCKCVPWLIHTRDTRHDSFIHIHDMAHSYTDKTWLNHT